MAAGGSKLIKSPNAQGLSALQLAEQLAVEGSGTHGGGGGGGGGGGRFGGVENGEGEGVARGRGGGEHDLEAIVRLLRQKLKKN